jgi:hypothetical protein
VLKVNIRDAAGTGKRRPDLASALPSTPALRYAERHRALPAPLDGLLEDSPSPVYGAALLMRFGSDPIRGSNPRSSAERTTVVGGLRPPPRCPQYLPGGTTPRTPLCEALRASQRAGSVPTPERTHPDPWRSAARLTEGSVTPQRTPRNPGGEPLHALQACGEWPPSRESRMVVASGPAPHLMRKGA